MHGNLQGVSSEAISAAAEFSRENSSWPKSAEPLFFAVMCRHLWGTNAAKELHFITGRSERTCRAWASGDSIPQSDVLFALLLSEHGRPVLDYIMQEGLPLWWQDILRAQRIVAAEDAIDRT